MCDISILTGAGCSISTTLRVFAKQLAWRNPSTLLLTPKYALVTAWKRGFLSCLRSRWRMYALFFFEELCHPLFGKHTGSNTKILLALHTVREE